VVIAAVYITVAAMIGLTHLPETKSEVSGEASAHPRLRDALGLKHLVKGRHRAVRLRGGTGWRGQFYHPLIIGGAVFSVLMGYVSDLSSSRTAFCLSLLCYLYIWYFAAKVSEPMPSEPARQTT
jgi:hypothetical protein